MSPISITWICLFVVVLVILQLKRTGQISSSDAADLLHKGAQIIDVRTSAEFTGGHLPNAINIPLSEVQALTPRRAPDKEQPLLLHCQSGARSGSAVRILKGMGYEKVYNLGSYARAKAIVETRKG